MMIHCLPSGKSRRKHRPLAAAPDHICDGVQDVCRLIFAQSRQMPVKAGLDKHGLHGREVCRIRAALRINFLQSFLTLYSDNCRAANDWQLQVCETMQIFAGALLPLKLRLSRSCTSSSAFCLSRIARYAPSPARPNMRHICDPCINIFCGMGSYCDEAEAESSISPPASRSGRGRDCGETPRRNARRRGRGCHPSPYRQAGIAHTSDPP